MDFWKIVLFSVLILMLSPFQVEVSSHEKQAWLKKVKEYDGVPYKWGGNSKEGIDCSGLVIELYHAIGIFLFKYENTLLLDVSADVLFKYNTRPIEFSELEPGDLIFYDTENDGIIDHVAIFAKKENGIIWVWDATDKIGNTVINKVSLRPAFELPHRYPKFGRPLKITNLLSEFF
ncbi:C40 family peptidase [Thermosipho melanesiensis]|uniref:NLP/P60 protein n=2 Tax=Thermosipho melanesiensis TaxID=46541 RepID=A6LJA8_THEM4|nr:NlpC/P60 family protein [Thermosipho melanesiensis]ABR30009.1 NLP/P60 protein [Thermosipho melanesiensis BI429]APT73213.1 hydrolase [Thermosipho melanesiensis]